MFDVIFFLSAKLSTKEGLITFGPFVALVSTLILSVFFTVLAAATSKVNFSGKAMRREKKSSSEGVTKSLLLFYFLLSPAVVITLVFICNISHPRMGVIARKVIPGMFSDYSQTSIEAQLPVHPKNMTEAYEYGRIYQRFSECSSLVNQQKEYDECVAAAINSAEVIYHNGAVPKPDKKKRNITTTDLEGLKGVIDEIDNRKGPLQKFASYFTLVGFMWAISILGICALVIPFVGVVFGELITKFFVNLILPLLEVIWKVIIRPFGGALLYCLSFWAIVESTRYPVNDAYSISGVMVALLGFGLFAAAWIYITTQLPSSGDNFRVWVILTSMTGFLFSVELAVIHQSKLMGYITIACLVAAVSYSVTAEVICEFLWSRWSTRHFDKELFQIMTGLFFIQIFGSAFAALEDREFLRVLLGHSFTTDAAYIAGTGGLVAPFRDSFAYVGGTVFFWFFLIISFFGNAHPFFISSCVIYIIVGFVFDSPALMQVAMVYLGAWATIFFLCETFRRSNLVIGGFVASCALFFLSNFLSNHPEYVTLIFYGPSK